MSIDREKYRKKCKHFNGTIHGTCKVGVDYAALVGDGKFIQLPCHPVTEKRRQELGLEVIPCPQFAGHTEADIDAIEAGLAASRKRDEKILPAHHAHPPRKQGSIEPGE